MAPGRQIHEHDTAEVRRTELLALFSDFERIRITGLWKKSDDVDEDKFKSIWDRYHYLTDEIDRNQPELEQDISVWTDDFCRNQSGILWVWLRTKYEEYKQIAECGFQTAHHMQAILEIQENLNTFVNMHTTQRLVELETMVVRKCIACVTNPCTVRFRCGHSCFCSYCFGLFRTTPREWGLDPPCPMCRSPIILNEIQEYDSVAIEAEYVEPVVQHTHPFDDFSDPIAEQVDTYTHVMRGHNRPNDEDFESVFGTPTRNW
jgi:hypothetical protein